MNLKQQFQTFNYYTFLVFTFLKDFQIRIVCENVFKSNINKLLRKHISNIIP